MRLLNAAGLLIRPGIRFGLILLASMLVGQVSAQTAGVPLRYTGTGSCAAAACHSGRREPLGLKGSEYAFWTTYDPHRKAYAVLFEERSILIERNYRRLDPKAVSSPERDATCLSCHVHSRFKPEDVDREMAFVADGVGCESCHGPAERYLAAHTSGWWRGVSDRDKSEQFGMIATKDLATRVKLCAECHIGSPDAEVNHDLIAAGHPRLLFEFANQQAKHPKHWEASADKSRDFDYEVRAWALGQAVATRASLELLEARAERSRSSETSPWPEFAEYDCYSCHHDLKAKSGRQDSARASGRPPGSLAWGNWNLPAIDHLAGLRGLDQIKANGSALANLRRTMADAEPDAATVIKLARMGSAELLPLTDRLATERFSRDDVDSLLGVFLKDQDPDWTDAARDYLAFVALARARGDLGGKPIDRAMVESLGSLRTGLTVPVVRPRDRLVDSPANFDPAQVKLDLSALRETLQR